MKGLGLRLGRVFRITKPSLVHREPIRIRVERRGSTDAIPPATAGLELGTGADQRHGTRGRGGSQSVPEPGTGHAARLVACGGVDD